MNSVMGGSMKGASYCCFCKAVSNNYLQKFLLINFTSTCFNWLNNSSFTHFVVVKGYGKYSLRKESVIAPFIEWFKTARESSSSILLVLRAICSTISFFLTFCLQKTINSCLQSSISKKYRRVLHKRSWPLLLSQSSLKQLL